MTEDPAVSRFRDFLRIKTVQPTPDYVSCSQFLERLAADMELPCQTFEPVKGKPVTIISWEGTDANLSSIMCNCHTDVVPVFPESWTYPPFDAHKTANGNIYARGAQDMKCVGMWYLEAIRRMKSQGIRLKRTIHCIFVPDEEIGGNDGMVALVNDERFKRLNIGFAMDEGLANPDEKFKVYYGERAPWWIKIRAIGNVGHGSQFIKNTAASRLYAIIGKLLEVRASEERRLELGSRPDGNPLTLGDVTSINWTISNGGVQYNVVPQNLEAGFDIRVSPSMSLIKFRKQLQEWCKEYHCDLEFINDSQSNPVTPIANNPWLEAIRRGSDECGVELDLEIFPAATDSRFLRLVGIPAIGVSAIRNTKILLHDHDEYLNERVFLDGIEWYQHVLAQLSQVSKEEEDQMQKI